MFEKVLPWDRRTLLIWSAITCVSFLVIGVACLVRADDTQNNYLRRPGMALHVAEPVCEAHTRKRRLQDERRTINCNDAAEFGRLPKTWVRIRSEIRYSFVTPSGQLIRAHSQILASHLTDVPRTGDTIVVLVHKTRPDMFRYGGELTYKDSQRFRQERTSSAVAGR